MLINLRNALMTGKRLPYDAEVEYLQSSGTQYINTGVILDSTYGIDITFAPMEDWHVSEHGIFGASNSSRHNVLQIQTSAAGVGLWMPASTRIAAKEYSTTGVLQHWQINIGNDGKVLIDGTNKGTTRPNSSSDLNQPIYLFARNLNGSLKSGSCSSMRLYSCKITDANGNAVFDPIPVRKGTVGYLYDRVSGKLFGNAGTGDFVVGPDVVPVEYIESTGTQWIDTGVYLTSNHSVEIDFQLTVISQSRKGLFGGLSTSRYGALLSPSNSKLEFGYGSGNPFYQIAPDALRHSTKQQKNLLYLDGVLINTFNEATFTSDFSAPLGNFSYTNYAPAQAKYYLSKWHDGDTLIRKFLPVRVGTDATSWEGAMMDVLTRRMYRNAGTGAFAYGNDLKYPIPA